MSQNEPPKEADQIPEPPNTPDAETGRIGPPSFDGDRQRPFREDVILALIEHGNRSLLILLIVIVAGIVAFIAKEPLTRWLSSAESVKLGYFEVQLPRQARSAGVSSELRSLIGLNDQQLQLFLIIGKGRETKAAGEFDISYSGEEITKENLEQLQSLGLINGVGPGTAPNTFRWGVTDNGKKLHKVLLDNATASIRMAAAVADCPAAGN